MIDLNDYYYFVHVVEKKGYTAAANVLGVPKSRLSRHVSQLEQRLGQRLIQRTSRSISITQQGMAFYQHARKLVDAMEMAEASVLSPEGNLSGSVRISCSVGVAQFALKELICQFALEYPNVVVEQHVTNSNIDLIAEGIDLAIRGHNAPLPDSSMIAHHLADVEWHFFASPSYYAEHPQLTEPCGLTDSRYLAMGNQHNASMILLQHDDGLSAQIQTSPFFCSQDLSTLKHAAMQSMGVAALPSYVCRKELKSGQVVRVLDGWMLSRAQLSLLMPSRQGIPPQVKALSDFLREHFSSVVKGS